MEVNESLAAGAGLTGPGSGAGAGGADLDKTAFLKLLVAQLQHQNPLEPMDNTEFVAQLAQFSGVEQLVSVNEGLNLLQVQQMGMANAQASTFIGKVVEVRSDKLEVTDGNDPVSGSFKLEGDATTLRINIRDGGGNIVRTMDLGPQNQGAVSFEWDSRDDSGNLVVPGNYRMDAVAEDGDGKPVTWQAQYRGVVSGIGYDKGYPELLIGSIRATLADIVSIYSNGPEQTKEQINP